MLPFQILSNLNELFPILLNCLADPDDEVVIVTMRVLAKICTPLQSPEQNARFHQVIRHLFLLFKDAPEVSKDKCSVIIR